MALGLVCVTRWMWGIRPFRAVVSCRPTMTHGVLAR